MYITHTILVNISYAAESANKTLTKMSKEETKEMVINYATEETNCFFGRAFDFRSLLDNHDEGEDEDCRSVIFANEDWDAFENVLLSADEMQKKYAKSILKYLAKNTGTLDLSELLTNLLLANDRKADKDSVDANTWAWDYLNQGSWALSEIARTIRGDYHFESGFYDTSRGTALVPFIDKLKKNPEEWALVRFEYQF